MFCCCVAEESAAQVIDVRPASEEASIADKASLEQAVNSVSFVAHLSRQDAEEPLGLKADFCGGKVLHVYCVTAEGGTAIARYNASAPDGRKIQVGDYFMAINGVSHETVQPPQKASDVLREQLLSSKSVEVDVRRPLLFECKIDKNGMPMGLELSYSNNGVGLSVAKINPGAVAACAPEIRSGDRIIRIGDTEGAPDKLLEAIHTAEDTMLFVMSRPAAAP